MKYSIILFSAIAVLLSSCATAASASSDGDIILFGDSTYLSVSYDTSILKSADDYLRAIEDNESLNVEWNDSMRDNPEALSVFSSQNRFYQARKVKLIGDLNKAFPDTPELKDLMLDRFDLNENIWELDIAEEVQHYAEKYGKDAPRIEKAWYFYYDGLIARNYRKEQPVLAALSAFDMKYPESEYSETLYSKGLNYLKGTPSEKMVEKIILERWESKQLKIDMKRKELPGTEFRLSFKDCITGNRINLEEWKGRIVVVDFWATWCGPCVAEMPEMKRIYGEYHSRGVEFVGISLDRDNKVLKDYCIENEIPWPQYCAEGPDGNPDFDNNWFITGIPTLFILDRSGRIYSVEARGQVERLINELL